MEKLKEVRLERTGWRDLKLDNILLNNNIWVPESFLVSEYNHGKSVAIIEYKGPDGILKPDIRLQNYCKLRKNKEYYFIIRFKYEKKENYYRFIKFEIYPGNEYSTNFLKERYKTTSTLVLNELKFIEFLYEIRDNISSPYYKKTVETYKDWFVFNESHDINRNIISTRHRSYAYDVPAVDIDSILFDKNNNPYLFIEYKANHNYGKIFDSGHNHFINSYISFPKRTLNNYGKGKTFNKALIDLGNGCKDPIPIIVTEYNIEHNVFSTYSLNEKSKTLELKDFTQEEYFQYIKDENIIKKRS